jgi:protein-tyrosine-phosphatase
VNRTLRRFLLNYAPAWLAPTPRVLVVCSGNTCRSPMGAAMLQYLRPRWYVESAGTGARTGDPIAKHSREVILYQIGRDLTRHRAQRVADVDIDSFDAVVGMNRGHLSGIEQRGFDGKFIQLLVTDPFGGPLDYYQEAAKKIDAQLREQLASWRW